MEDNPNSAGRVAAAKEAAKAMPENGPDELAKIRAAIAAHEARVTVCLRAFKGIPDPAAFMEEVREVARDCQKLADLTSIPDMKTPCVEPCGRTKCALVGCVNGKKLRARALLEKMEGK